MNPLLSEALISLTALANRAPQGRGTGPSHSAHRSTVVRWVTRGVVVAGKRIKLEAARVGGRWMTSEQAYTRFVAACGAASGVTAPAKTPAQVRRESERASHTLDRMFERARQSRRV